MESFETLHSPKYMLCRIVFFLGRNKARALIMGKDIACAVFMWLYCCFGMQFHEQHESHAVFMWLYCWCIACAWTQNNSVKIFTTYNRCRFINFSFPLHIRKRYWKLIIHWSITQPLEKLIVVLYYIQL